MKIEQLVGDMVTGGKLPQILFHHSNKSDGVLFHYFVPSRREGDEEQFLLFRRHDERGSGFEAIEYEQFPQEGAVAARFLAEVEVSDEEDYWSPSGIFHFVSIDDTPLDRMVWRSPGHEPYSDPTALVSVPDGDPEWVTWEEFLAHVHWRP